MLLELAIRVVNNLVAESFLNKRNSMLLGEIEIAAHSSRPMPKGERSFECLLLRACGRLDLAEPGPTLNLRSGPPLIGPSRAEVDPLTFAYNQ